MLSNAFRDGYYFVVSIINIDFEKNQSEIKPSNPAPF